MAGFRTLCIENHCAKINAVLKIWFYHWKRKYIDDSTTIFFTADW